MSDARGNGDTQPPAPPEPALLTPPEALAELLAGTPGGRASEVCDELSCRLATWPAPLVVELNALAARFPADLRHGFLDLLVLGHLSPELDTFVEANPGVGDLVFQGTRLHGEATLGVAIGTLPSRVSRAVTVPALRPQIPEPEPRCRAATIRHALRRMARWLKRPRG